jgi:hypothetical protein
MAATNGNSNGKASRAQVREIIGRTGLQVSGSLWTRFQSYASIDQTVPDYKFFDDLRNGKARGFELAGLFCSPIIEVVSGWVMGDGFTATTDDEYTDGLLAELVKRSNALFLNLTKDAYALGDQYVIVNPDGSFSIPSPDTVTRIPDPLDYRTAIGYSIQTTLDKVTIVDEFRLDGRTITVKTKDAAILASLSESGWQIVPEKGDNVARLEFENLIGRIPVVHFANDRGVNETNGRPIYERCYRLFSRYDDLLNKMLDGAQLMGNPIPVFQGMEDVNETVEANGTPTGETYVDIDGNQRERTQIEFDTLTTIVLGKGGAFQFAAPNVGFTDDIRNALKVLFLLMLETVRVPEVVWGNEQSGKLATGDEQMNTFHSFIQSRRVMLEGEGASDELGAEAHGGLLELLDIWLRTMALVNPRVKVGPVAMEWPELSNADMKIILDWAKAMHDSGVITDEMFATLSQLIDDPAGEVEKARKEAEERMPDIPDIEVPTIADETPAGEAEAEAA